MKRLIVLMGSALILGGITLFSIKQQRAPEPALLNNVSVVDGKQIIEIKAKGGFNPAKTSAKAGIPTILRFATSGTFDCSSSVRIPSLNMLKTLGQSGSTDIDIGTPLAGIMNGTCGMGMYPFSITFTD